jgi:hypothetical protein
VRRAAAVGLGMRQGTMCTGPVLDHGMKASVFSRTTVPIVTAKTPVIIASDA